jgi:hypothetical protein
MIWIPAGEEDSRSLSVHCDFSSELLEMYRANKIKQVTCILESCLPLMCHPSRQKPFDRLRTASEKMVVSTL